MVIHINGKGYINWGGLLLKGLREVEKHVFIFSHTLKYVIRVEWRNIFWIELVKHKKLLTLDVENLIGIEALKARIPKMANACLRLDLYILSWMY